MARRCLHCSAEVSEKAKFCRSCGKSLEEAAVPQVAVAPAAEPSCPGCGKAVPAGARFCRHCGGRLEPFPAAVSPAAQEAGGGESFALSAPDRPGELSFVLPKGAALMQAVAEPPDLAAAGAFVGPLRVLFSGLWGLIRSFLAALRSPGKLMPGVFLGSVWLVLTALPALGITLPGQEQALWATFAQGGLQGGTTGALGGVLGKGVYAAVLTGLFRARPKKQAASGVSASPQKSRGAIGLLLMGIGSALMLFNFFTYDNSLQNSIIGLVSALGVIRGMGHSGGFLHRLVTAFAQRFTSKRAAGPGDVKLLGHGLAAGFLTAVPLSAISGPMGGYVLGFLVLVPGLALAMLRKNERAVKRA